MIVRNVDVVREGTETLQAVGVQTIETDSAYDTSLERYLTQFGRGGVQELSAFSVSKTHSAHAVRQGQLDWSFADSEKDHADAEVFYAHCAINRKKDPLPHALRGGIDNAEKLLTGRLRGSIVAACGMRFCGTQKSIGGSAQEVTQQGSGEGHASAVEIYELVFGPEYDRDVLLVGMLRCAYILAYQAGNQYLVCAANGEDLQLKRLGFRKTSLLENAIHVGDAKVAACVADVVKVMSGEHIGFSTWQRLFAYSPDVSLSQATDSLGIATTTRLRLYRAWHQVSIAGNRFLGRAGNHRDF
ncbi:MAG: hypothetical protein EOO38_11115 [Cytophagaceae bacterium]|nr:MAG: hypothetical protein EOO38_11115 [Cytophagaceae bacterium]